MSSEERPHLRSVDAPPVDEAEGPASGRAVPEAVPGEPSRARGWLVPALSVGLLACAVGWLWEARGAAELEARLATSQAALARSEARVSVLEGYVGAVRERFATLQATLESELEALGGLLSSEPGATPSDGD